MRKAFWTLTVIGAVVLVAWLTGVIRTVNTPNGLQVIAGTDQTGYVNVSALGVHFARGEWS